MSKEKESTLNKREPAEEEEEDKILKKVKFLLIIITYIIFYVSFSHCISPPWENCSQESFYWKFKFELWNLNRFNTLEEAIEAIHAQIYYYNNYRIHTTLKMSPKEFREEILSKFF